VLRLFVKANAQVANRRYYAALKTMTALQTEHLPSVAQYTFARRILDKIPLMKNKIKDSAAQDMQDFLLYIRDKGLAIGEAAMNRTLRMMNVRAGGTKEEIDYTETTDLADFSPIYRCLHIYEVLVRASPLAHTRTHTHTYTHTHTHTHTTECTWRV
jgi:hypothetical protein